MTEFFDDSDRLIKLMASVDKKFQRRFLDTVRTIRSAHTLDQLEALIIAGRVEEALVSAEIASLQLSNYFGDAFILSGNETAKVIENALEVIVNFDQVNTRALNAMTRNQLRLVREFVSEQRRATRVAMIDGIERGINPRDMARAFRDSIGLTAKQQTYVINYRTQLQSLDSKALGRKLRDRRFDRTIQAAIKNDKPLTSAQIDKMVERYQQRWVKYRSEVIGRTEALSSVHEGTDEMYQQAIDSGTLDLEELIRTWDSSNDGRDRSHHLSMNKQQRQIDEPFTSGLGNALRRPGDSNAPAEERIHCRCAVTTRFTDSAKQRVAQSAPSVISL